MSTDAMSEKYFYIGLAQVLLVAGLAGLRGSRGEREKILWDALIVLVPIVPMFSLLAEILAANRENDKQLDAHWYVGIVVSAQAVIYAIIAYAGLWQIGGELLMVGVPIALYASFCWGKGNESVRLGWTRSIFLLSLSCMALSSTTMSDDVRWLSVPLAISLSVTTGYVIGILQSVTVK